MSIRAKLICLLLKVTKRGDTLFGTAENAQKMMNKNVITNGQPLTIPKIKSQITEKYINGFPVYWLENNSNTKESIILYIHGGAWTNQPISLHWKYVDKIARSTRMPLVMTIYPKAPVHQFTDAYDFLTSVYTELLNLGYTNITFMGDSAGATLSLGLTMYLRKQNMPIPSKLVLLSPLVDTKMDNPEIPNAKQHDPIIRVPGILEILEVWSGGSDLSDYRLSPINGDLRNLPPTMLFIGSYEIFCPDARKFKRLADKAGTHLIYREYPKMFHCFPAFPIPEADKATKEILDFIRS